MKPVTQIFNLLLEQMTNYNKPTVKNRYNKQLKIINSKYAKDKKKLIEKITKLRDGIVKKIIFENSLRISDNAKKGQRTISNSLKQNNLICII